MSAGIEEDATIKVAQASALNEGGRKEPMSEPHFLFQRSYLVSAATGGNGRCRAHAPLRVSFPASFSASFSSFVIRAFAVIFNFLNFRSDSAALWRRAREDVVSAQLMAQHAQ